MARRNTMNTWNEANPEKKKAYKIFFREGLRAEEAVEKIKSECVQDKNINTFIESIQSSERGVIR